MASGFPDWQRTQLWQGDPILEDLGVTYQGVRSYGPFFVGAWNSFQVQWSVGTQPQQITFQWFTDQAATRGLGGQPIVCDANTQANMAIPNRGAWLMVGVVARNQLANATYGLRIVPSNRISRGVFALAPAFVIQQTNLNVLAASSTVVREASKWAGRVHVYASSSATSWEIILESEDIAGNVHRWGDVSTSTGPANQLISALIPPEIIRARLINNDGMTEGFDLSIIPDQNAI